MMMRWVGLLVAVLMVVGCTSEEESPNTPPGETTTRGESGIPDAGEDAGTTGQERYTYPGCENRTTYCPRDFTFTCAMEAIEQQYAQGCTRDADCVFVTLPNNCAGYGSCDPRPVVLTSLRAEYETKAAAEVQRYCADAQCVVSGACAPVIQHPACDQGRCVAHPGEADAGP